MLPRHDMAEMGIWDGPGHHAAAAAAAEMGNFAKTINLPPPLSVCVCVSPSPCYASIMIGSVCQEPHLVDAKIGSCAGSAHRRSAGL